MEFNISIRHNKIMGYKIDVQGKSNLIHLFLYKKLVKKGAFYYE